jgi:Bcr/CflA subfamily drug resistance transporter
MKQMNNLNLSNKRIRLITWTLLALIPIIGMAVDLIAPSLPAITEHLNTSSTTVQNTISLYLIGYGLGNFISGILTDAFGRRLLILGGLCGFVLISLAAATIPNIEVLLIARFLQGLMLGTLAVIVRAILADILPAEKLVALGVMIGMMWGIGPIIGPVIGGYLQTYYGYQAGFFFFAIVGALGLLAVFTLVPETCIHRYPLQLQILKQNFTQLLSHNQFIALSILMGLNYSLVIIFNTAGPFLIQTKLHYSAIQFGDLALYLGMVFLVATSVCRYLLTKFNDKHLFFVSVNLFWMLAIFFVIVSYVLNQGVILIAIASAVMFLSCGMLFPLSMGKGMSLFSHIPGSATATMYLINTMITSTSAAIISLINMQDSKSLMWTYLFLTSTAMLIYWKLIHNPKQA